jgi:cytochrome c oxidase subunit 2
MKPHLRDELQRKRESVLRRILLVAVCATLFAPGMLLRSDAGTPRRIEITAKRFSYDPGTITLKKGETVLLVLKSADVPHGLRFRELSVEVKAPKGGTGQVQFTPNKTGDFVGHCSVFCGAGHGSMTLTLHVVE